MRRQPIEVVRILEEQTNLVTGRRSAVRYFTAMWKRTKIDCGHEHRTERAAERCLPVVEKLREKWLALERAGLRIMQ